MDPCARRPHDSRTPDFTPQFKKDASRSCSKAQRHRGRPRPRHRSQPAAALAGPAARDRDGAPGARQAEPLTPRPKRSAHAPAAAAGRHGGAGHPKKSLGVLRGRPEVKFHFIAVHRTEFRVRSHVPGARRLAQRLLRLARRPLPRASQRNEALLVQHSRGARRPAADLRLAAHSPSAAQARRRVRASSRRAPHALRRHRRCTERHFRWTATARANCPRRPIACSASFTRRRTQSRWVSDITSVRTGQGWLHLAIVLDLYSRRIVGWAMRSDARRRSSSLEALAMAIAERRPAPGLIFHSDRGGQYLSPTCRSNSTRRGSSPASSRPGGCLDNAVAESFFHTLKTELVYQHHYRDARRSAPGDLRVHRSVLQPHASALGDGLRITEAYEYETCTAA